MTSRTPKSLLFYIIILLLSVVTQASAISPWLQYPAISPDGKAIAFAYQGMIYKVSSKGGTAVALTSGGSYNFNPVWSHDSRKIAFASDRNGNLDVYVMDSGGGRLRRLTHHSGQDIPYEFAADDQSVLFGTIRHDQYSSVRFPLERGLPVEENFAKLYRVPVNGGFNVLINAAGMEYAHLNRDGSRIIYQDNKGSIDSYYRKHQLSASTRDIWCFDIKHNNYTRLSAFAGEDREPLWGDKEDFYYLSERSGSFNLYRSAWNDTAKITQLTFFKAHPVRSVSRSVSGTFAFSFNGDLYTFQENARPEKLLIRLPQQRPAPSAEIKVNSADEACLSANGKQVAFVARGDIFVISADGKKIRQVTNTPYQERMPSFSPNGKLLAYAVEDKDSWNIALASVSDDGSFYSEKKPVNTKILLASPKDEFQPLFSPDGNKIAYVQDRDKIRIYDLNTHLDTEVLKEGYNFSSKDGDQYFAWSADSRHLLAKSKLGSIGHENEIILLSLIPGQTPCNLTRSGFDDISARFSSDGKSIYWLSNRFGLMNFTRSESQYDLFQMQIPPEVLSGSEKPASLPGNTGNLPAERLTKSAADVRDLVVPPGDTILYYLERSPEGYDLWKMNLLTHASILFKKLGAGDPRLSLSGDGSVLLLSDQGGLSMISALTGELQQLKVDITMHKDLGAERLVVFDHVYNRVKKRFFQPDLNGVRFDDYYRNYRKFIPSVSSNYDLAILVSELFGELNTSHIAAYYSPDQPNADLTAGLGLLYDETQANSGLVVREVMNGGPFDNKTTKMSPGMVIKRINDTLVNSTTDWPRLLNHKANKAVKITFSDPTSGKTYAESVNAISLSRERSVLLYNRWIRQMEKITDSLSAGRIGYVHVRQMGEESFRTLYQDALGKYRDKEALIVDTRFNIGGSLHDELLDFLSGDIYLTERRQGRPTAGGESYRKWNKPSTVLVGQGNYSDAFLFPYLYQKRKLGKVIGMPVPGTGTATIGEDLIIPDMFIAVPQGGTYAAGSTSPTENHEMKPDITVEGNYKELGSGTDKQLEKAIDVLRQTLSKQPNR
jgi:tricorn protease